MENNKEAPPRRSEVTLSFLFAVIVVAFGSGFQYGYNISVLNAPYKEISYWIGNSSYEGSRPEDVKYQITLIYSIAVSIYGIGGLVGSLATLVTLKYHGIKGGIIASDVIAFIAVASMGIAVGNESYIFFIISRLVIGVSTGVSSSLAPIYLREISPASVRGAIGASFQLCITMGVVSGLAIGLEEDIFGDEDWPYIFVVIAVVAIVQILTIPICPDSPEHLYAQGEINEAREALVWLRGTEDVEDELMSIRRRKAEADAVGKVSLREMFVKVEYRKPLIIACALQFAQMFSGINAIMAYSTSTFEVAQLDDLSKYGTVSLGVVNVLVTTVSLFTVQHFGRKVLLVFSFVTMTIDILLFFVSFLIAESKVTWASYACIFFLVMFIIFYACGAGPIPWFIVSELFSQATRATAVTLAVIAHWISFFIIGLTFPLLQSWIGPYSFIVFFILLVLFSIYMIFVVPETKGKSVEQITAEFKS